MTENQIHQYNTRYLIDRMICQRCGRPSTQIAHRLSKSKVNYKKYGHEIIDHDINLVSVCGLKCNSSFNIGCSTMKEIRLVALIRQRGNERLSSEKISNYINGVNE